MSDLSSGRTILILAVVIGCFGVLWPKVFYPMLTASLDDVAPKANPVPHPHARPERPHLMHPEMVHPAMRDKGRTLPQRTIDRDARPGPKPGVRPPMGAGAHMPPTQSTKGGSGAMGIVMPLYTIGIVIFFLYTILKVLYKKTGEEDNSVPKLKDFHLDPEYRKYVFAEEYLDNSNASHRDVLKKQEREASKQRKRIDSLLSRDTKIGKSECEKKDEQMDQLRHRLEETEKAMEKLMSQMGTVTDKLTAAKITEVLSHAQAQAKILKMGLNYVFSAPTSAESDAPSLLPPSIKPSHTSLPRVSFEPSPEHIFFQREAAEVASDDDFTTSEAFTNTISDDFSLPMALQRHLQELKVKDSYLKGISASFIPPPTSPHGTKSVNEQTAWSRQVTASCLPENNNVQFSSTLSVSENQNNQYLYDNSNKCMDTQNVEQGTEGSDLNTDEQYNIEMDLLSDIAVFGDDFSKRENSDESDTGADVSELRSFSAEDYYIPNEHSSFAEFEAPIIPELDYCANDVFDSKINLVEHSTQTEIDQKYSILNVSNTYTSDSCQGTDIQLNLSSKINEIILDATLPLDSQLLVKESRTGSSLSDHIEVDASVSESEPCIVTSQLSLAFVGMEQSRFKILPPTLHMNCRSGNDSKLEFVNVCSSPSEQISDSSTLNEKNSHKDNNHNHSHIKTMINVHSDDNQFFRMEVQNQTLLPSYERMTSFDSVDLTPELLQSPFKSVSSGPLLERPYSPLPTEGAQKIYQNNLIPNLENSNIGTGTEKYDNYVQDIASFLSKKITDDVISKFPELANRYKKSRSINFSNKGNPVSLDTSSRKSTNTVVYKMQLGEVGEKQGTSSGIKIPLNTYDNYSNTKLSHHNLHPVVPTYSSKPLHTQSPLEPTLDKTFRSSAECSTLKGEVEVQQPEDSQRTEEALRNRTSEDEYEYNRRGGGKSDIEKRINEQCDNESNIESSITEKPEDKTSPRRSLKKETRKSGNQNTQERNFDNEEITSKVDEKLKQKEIMKVKSEIENVKSLMKHLENSEKHLPKFDEVFEEENNDGGEKYNELSLESKRSDDTSDVTIQNNTNQIFKNIPEQLNVFKEEVDDNNCKVIEAEAIKNTLQGSHLEGPSRPSNSEGCESALDLKSTSTTIVEPK